jgi:hypothetical protein
VFVVSLPLSVEGLLGRGWTPREPRLIGGALIGVLGHCLTLTDVTCLASPIVAISSNSVCLTALHSRCSLALLNTKLPN